METWKKLLLKAEHDPRVWFALGGLGIGTFGVAALWFGIFPLETVNLLFFTGLLFFGALYRPNWCFLLLMATLPFETVNVVSFHSGPALRPYQWVFLVISAALLVRLFSGRTWWPLIRFERLDAWLALVPIGAIISGLMWGGEGPRLAAVVVSFYALYLLGRVFLKTTGDVHVAFITLAASGAASLCFGIIQNIAFEQGRFLQAVMPGRPNGTFAEPDWLGFFSVLLLVLAFISLYRTLKVKETETDDTDSASFRILWRSLALLPILVTVILTVSRSAWLAAALAILVWAGTALLLEGKAAVHRMLQSLEILAIVCVVSLLIVVDVPLTRFDLLNRAESTATGLQEITIACASPTNLPTEIESVNELESFGCRHIALEEREVLAQAGLSIQTTRRPDPNVLIRSGIYRQTWGEIRAHPVFGIGWGNIGTVLGRDEHGAAYNASNVWLEVLLGAGVVGLVGLLGALGEILFCLVRGVSVARSALIQSHAPLVLSCLSVFVIFNLFNAGLLIGFVWICFAAVPALLPLGITKKI